MSEFAREIARFDRLGFGPTNIRGREGRFASSSLEPLHLSGIDAEDTAMLCGHHIATTNGTPDRALADAEDSGSVSGG